ncbi:MAG TPA: hypothetical protein VGG15_08995 [Terriglobales bacterium]|jgi:hypothetical protein
MAIPKACPVCATEVLEPIMRKQLSSGTDASPQRISGVLAYRCNKGHVFTVAVPDDQPRANSKGAGK